MSDGMERLTAALAGRYRVERELGQGGMATVYLAEDLKHHRKVAIKVLHAELSALLGAERFLKEIELTASLQHPHILPLFDSGEVELTTHDPRPATLLYYVMPFVDGESLRARLEREAQLPVSDAVRIASEVADALRYAHSRGVIHRDIKPENILLQNGHALVADFGIALAVQQAGGQRMTQTGLSLGTPQYMSPEQAVGDRAVDVRTDIYSLGAVTYEMLAGEPPFTGPNAQAILARVITERPRPLDEVRDTAPPGAVAAVHTALAKLPADRQSSAEHFSAGLAGPSASPISAHHARTSGPVAGWRRWRVAGVAAAAVALGAATDRVAHRSPAPAAAAPVRFSVIPDSGFALGRFAIAPDGSAIAFWANRPDGSAELLIRGMDDVDARPLAVIPHGQASGVGQGVFFSADAKWVGYIANGAIEKLPTGGGTPVMLARAPNARGAATWAPDGTIYYDANGGALMQVPPDGRPPERLLALGDGRRLFAPSMLPDGRSMLVSVASVSTEQLLWTVLDLRTGKIGALHPGSMAAYVDPGDVVYADENGRIWRQPLDIEHRAPAGAPRSVPRVLADAFAVSRTGSLVFLPTDLRGTHLMLVDRQGHGRTLPGLAFAWAPRFSPDGRRVAFAASATSGDAYDVWVLDLAAGTSQRITTDSVDNNDAQWSPDENLLVYSSNHDSSVKDLYIDRADGGGGTRLLLHRAGAQWSSDWSPDGRWILFTNVAPDGENDIWMVRADGKEARPWLATPFLERGGTFSPDGHWVAYISNESGEPKVYIQSFPTPGGKRVVSTNAGNNPVWRGDGRELYYCSDGQLVAVQLAWDADGPRVTGRTPLFKLPYVEGPHANYDATADGQRFVVNVGSELANRIVVELNSMSPRSTP